MRCRNALVFSCLWCLATPGCVKRISVSAGEDRILRAGEVATFGEDVDGSEDTRVLWSMGDGIEMKGARVTHSWDLPGNYRVTVQVTDEDGESRESQAKVQVRAPPLLEVLPPRTDFLLLFDRSGDCLASVPLFLERLFPSGQEANATISFVREWLGFDPFSREGVRAAGLDPEGGVAVAGFEENGKGVGLLVISLLPGAEGVTTFRRLLGNGKEVREVPAKSNANVFELFEIEKNELRAAWTVFRGHLWIAVPDGENNPAALLSSIRAERTVAANVGISDDLRRARDARSGSGVVEVIVSKAFLKRAAAFASSATSSSAPTEGQRLAERIEYVYASVEMNDNRFEVAGRAGFSGREARVLANALRAGNAVPPFGSFVDGEAHLLIKLSAALPVLWKTLLDLTGQGGVWDRMIAALDKLGSETGLRLKAGLIENLGDSFLLWLRFNPDAILWLFSGVAGQNPGLGVLLDAVLYVQLRDQRLLVNILETLARAFGPNVLSQGVETGRQSWQFGPANARVNLIVDHGFAVLATSSSLAGSALERIAAPRPAPEGWPAGMQAADHQVLYLNLNALAENLKQMESSQEIGFGTGTMLKAILLVVLEKVGVLDTATVDLVLADDGLRATLTLNLR